MSAQGSPVRRVLSVALSGLLLASVAVGWWYGAPPQLGGRTSYVSVVGTSMEPELRPGDLVVVRPAADYGPGDVVAYRSASLNAVVLHRIVGIEADGFVMQGDANDWVDSERPSGDEIVGAMAFRVAGAGSVLAWLNSPPGVSVLAALLVLFVLMGFGRRRRRHHGTEQPLPSSLPARSEVGIDPARDQVGVSAKGAPTGSRVTSIAAWVLGVGLVGFVLVGALAITSPAMKIENRTIPYEQEGGFTYTADVPAGQEVYGPNGVRTGDPVYLRLASDLAVTFDYDIDVPALESAGGTIELSAAIADVDGWRRAFVLAPALPFEGGHATAAGTLHLADLRELVRDVRKATGVEREAYAVEVVATVTADATVSGVAVPMTMNATLPFLLNELELQLFPGDGGPEAVLHPVVGGAVEAERVVPNEISLVGFEVRPARVGEIAFVLAGLSLLGLAALLLMRRRSRRRAEHELIEARYGRLLVSVGGDAADVLDRAIDVETMETLVQLAGHYDQVILHGEHEGRHLYFFRDNGIAYCYRAGAVVARQDVADAVP